MLGYMVKKANPKHTQHISMYTCTLGVSYKWEERKNHTSRGTFFSVMRVEMNDAKRGNKTGCGHAPIHLWGAQKILSVTGGKAGTCGGQKKSSGCLKKAWIGAQNMLGKGFQTDITNNTKTGGGGGTEKFLHGQSNDTNTSILGGHKTCQSDPKTHKWNNQQTHITRYTYMLKKDNKMITKSNENGTEQHKQDQQKMYAQTNEERAACCPKTTKKHNKNQRKKGAETGIVHLCKYSTWCVFISAKTYPNTTNRSHAKPRTNLHSVNARKSSTTKNTRSQWKSRDRYS